MEPSLAWKAILWMKIANYGMNTVRNLTLKRVENFAIRKILKIGVLRCFKVAKRAATPLKKKAIWRKKVNHWFGKG